MVLILASSTVTLLVQHLDTITLSQSSQSKVAIQLTKMIPPTLPTLPPRRPTTLPIPPTIFQPGTPPTPTGPAPVIG
jgi:hypothetical protein